jgi:hypothetical protein
MSRPFLPLVLLLVLTSASSPAGAQVAEAPLAAGCSRSAAAASRVVEESCTDDIVRSFFGVRGRDLCCRALEAIGVGCYHVAFSGSPFADVYLTILGNVCGLALAAAPAPSPGARDRNDRATTDLLL